MKDEIIAAVAQGWCTKENENKPMDSTLAMAIVDNVIVVIEKLEKQESDYRKIIYEVLGCKPIPACERDDDKLEPPWEVVKRIRLENEKLEAMIEELISAKGIKELDARLAEAEREACAKTIELIIGVDVGWEDADTIRVAAKAIRKRGNE